MTVTRRQLLAGGGAVAAATALTGCSGFTGSGSSDSADELTFTTWGSDSELAGFRAAIAGFEKANSGVTVNLNAVPYEQISQTIDAQFQAKKPPDLFRVQYYNFGAYAARGQLLDLSSHLEDPTGARFTDALWRAVQSSGKPYGVPHHTDTSAILYNKEALSAAGIKSVPETLDDVWSWQEFEQAALKLRASLPSAKFPFIVNWQKLGVTRWLSWLYEANGRFLDTDLKTAAINSTAGKQAVDFTSSFFPRRLVPANSTVKTATYAQDAFFNGTAAMCFAGAFLIPDAATGVNFDWGATLAPHDLRGGSDLGGNALVATAGSSKPKLAAKFLDYMTQEDTERDFCERASLLPSLKSLVSSGIKFTVRPDLSPIFIQQASTVRPADAAQATVPSMSKIITVLQDQLDLAFTGKQSTGATLSNLATGISSATHG